MTFDILTPEIGFPRHNSRFNRLRSRAALQQHIEPGPSHATLRVPDPKRSGSRNVAGAISGWILAAIGFLLVAGCGSGLVGPSAAGPTSLSPLTPPPLTEPPSTPSPSTPPLTSAPLSIYVAWQPHSDPTVTGYVIYYGPSVAAATTVASDQRIDDPNFDPQAPSVSYDLAAQLGLQDGDTVCFRLKAYNADGESGFSSGICTTV